MLVDGRSLAHQESGHVEVVAGHVHEDAAAVLEVGHRRRRGVAAGDVDGAHVADGAVVDLTAACHGFKNIFLKVLQSNRCFQSSRANKPSGT